MSALKHVFK